MQNIESFLDRFKQNNRLPIRLVSPSFGHLPKEAEDTFPHIHRSPYYFILFMVEGVATRRVDLQEFVIESNELLFILPHQIHEMPPAPQGKDYYKLGFDDQCISLLPKQYPFLINPFNQQKIKLATPAAARLQAIFKILHELLNSMDTEVDLILAHLNSLLTEINTAYFATGKNPAPENLSKYIGFKLFVENNLTTHPTIISIAEALSLNANSLYTIVKHYSGLSPKEFITSRLMLEAKRQLYYAESSSIKELAYALGFNDPEYFSRLFKKETGKTINAFIQDLSGK